MLDVLERPGAGRRAEAEGEAGHPALAGRRREPARDVGPQAGRADRRAVPVDPDRGPRHPDLRADAEDGPADGPHLHHPLAEHQERRPRRRRPADDARAARRRRACATPTWGPSWPASSARPQSQVPDYVSFYSATEGRDDGARVRRLPRPAVRADGADHGQRSPRTSAASTRSPSSTTSSAPSCASC